MPDQQHTITPPEKGDHGTSPPAPPPESGITASERARLEAFLTLPMGERVQRGIALSRAALSALGAARRPPA